MSTPVTIASAPIPAGFCFRSWEMSWPELVALLTGSISGDLSSFTASSSTPTPDNQDRPWFKTDEGRWYSFSEGFWLSRYTGPAEGIIVMYHGTEASIPTLDGGEAAAITDKTGPFWVKSSAFDARFPIGPGVLPSAATIAVTGTGGEERVTLTEAQLPAHTHSVDAPATKFDERGTGANLIWSGEGTDTTGPAGSGESHNNMPPYVGTWFIVRTARLFYRI